MKRLLLLLCFCGVQAAAASDAEDVAAIRQVLTQQTVAWNRGDLVSFVDSYDQEAVFVGKKVARGKTGVWTRYRQNYATAAKRGTLEFTDLEVKILGRDYASVIGHFHLTRTEAGGGDSRGIFTLLFQKKPGQGWKIILDHTS